MTDDEKFFERLRGDAASLRYRVDDATLARIGARIQDRIAPKPTLAELLASWFRPLAAGLAAIALAAAIGLTLNTNESTFGEQQVEIVMGGDTYLVGD
jgi:hypothetical protein